MSAPVDVFKKEHLPEKIAAKIAAEFGDDYLLDSNMIVFYRGEFSKDQVEKLFSITNKAFGEDANRMTLGDFKKFSMDSDGPVPQPGDDDSKEEEESNGSDGSSEGGAGDAESSSSSDARQEAGSSQEDQPSGESSGSEEAAAEAPDEGAGSQAEGVGSEEDEEDKQLDKEVDEIVNGGEDQVDEDDGEEAAQLPAQQD